MILYKWVKSYNDRAKYIPFLHGITKTIEITCNLYAIISEDSLHYIIT